MYSKRIVLFDMDDTLISADTMFLWTKFLEKKESITQAEIQKREKLHTDYLNRTLNVYENFEFEISLLKRITKETRELWQKEFFESLIKPALSQKGLKLIETYKKNDDTLVILTTASLSFFAATVADHTGVHHFIATEAEIQNDIYTGKVCGIPNLGEGKVERFKLWCEAEKITPSHITLYSDSMNDLPLFQFVHKPIAVDPDKQLERFALENAWEIISLKAV